MWRIKFLVICRLVSDCSDWTETFPLSLYHPIYCSQCTAVSLYVKFLLWNYNGVSGCPNCFILWAVILQFSHFGCSNWDNLYIGNRKGNLGAGVEVFLISLTVVVVIMVVVMVVVLMVVVVVLVVEVCVTVDQLHNKISTHHLQWYCS